MDEHELMLDGNALAGLLSEVFAVEATMVRTSCGSCGTVADIGEQHLYMNPSAPGCVLRCAHCEAILMVAVRMRERMRIGFPGIVWLETP